MPTEFLIDGERRLIVSRGTGVFRLADHLEHMEALGRDPRFNPDYDHIVDCRHFELLDLTRLQLEEMARRSNFATTSRRALVASPGLHFGLSRMFATYRGIESGQTAMVFSEMSNALDWLGLPPDYAPQDSPAMQPHSPPGWRI